MTSKFAGNDDHDEYMAEASQDAFHKVEVIVHELIVGLQQKGDHHQPHHLYVILTAMAAAAQVAAKIMSVPQGQTDEEYAAWVEKPVDRTAILAAALLMSRCLLPTKDGIAFDFNSLNICAAIEATKQITGNPDVSVLNENMRVAAARYATPARFFDNSRDEFGDLIPTVH